MSKAKIVKGTAQQRHEKLIVALLDSARVGEAHHIEAERHNAQQQRDADDADVARRARFK